MTDNGILTAAMGTQTISIADTSISGSGSTTLIEGEGNGTYIGTVIIKALEDTSEGMIRFFIEDNGGNSRMFIEVPVIASNPSNFVPSFTRTLMFDDLFLPSGWFFKVSTVVSESFNVMAAGSNLTYPA